VAQFRILVTGSRDFTDFGTIYEAIQNAAFGVEDRDIVVVHGNARGADKLARLAAIKLGFRHEPHPADWDGYGRAAGFIRNAEMVNLGADICLAVFQSGAGNRGTNHCSGLAVQAGIPVTRITNRKDT
jgi:hypothetical protein